jgi:hypothetical protein
MKASQLRVDGHEDRFPFIFKVSSQRRYVRPTLSPFSAWKPFLMMRRSASVKHGQWWILRVRRPLSLAIPPALAATSLLLPPLLLPLLLLLPLPPPPPLSLPLPPPLLLQWVMCSCASQDYCFAAIDETELKSWVDTLKTVRAPPPTAPPGNGASACDRRRRRARGRGEPGEA